jgi:hypothetical protein
MREITSKEEFQLTLTEPSIFVFSSVTCQPCLLLKKWLQSEFPEEDINLILVENLALRSITDEIDVLPTIVYYVDGKVSIQIEEFDKSLIREMIEKKRNLLKKKVQPRLKEVNVDEILKRLHDKLQ